jgi:uroporphyrinogen III methyltransferase/synthase
MTEQSGKVYLVGAGPGDVAYLTVRAQQLLHVAEVLIYDALVDAQLLQLVPSDCLQLDVGKRGGKPSTPQAQINQMLVEHCQSGKQVIRLKSGDPFIFGRSASEIEALVAAGCPFEVVPGISSALAAPELAGIPLTDPVLSRCFAVTTAHEPEQVDWEGLTPMGTLVILMGGQQLPEIVHQLLRHGRSRHTPVAIIRWAGTRQQQVWTAPLENIVEQTVGVSLSPSVIVIGEVVGLRNYLQPTDSEGKRQEARGERQEARGRGAEGQRGRGAEVSLDLYSSPASPASPASPSPHLPLAGKTILVTRSVGQSSQFGDRLTKAGATVIEMPAIEIAPPSSWEALDRAIAHLSDFNWLILTSTNGVDYFFERLATQGKDARALAGVKIAVVGEKTASCLKQHCLQPDFIPPDFVADSMVAHFPDPLEGKKVLFPRVETGGREVLVKELTAQGAEVIEVAAYQSRCPQAIAPDALEALQRHAVDIITFASSKTVQNFCQLVEVNGGANLNGVCIASIGPQTSKTCVSLLGRVDVEAEEYTMEGLFQSLISIPKIQ